MNATSVAPHSTEMEQATLGALIIDCDAFIDAQARVAPEDFYEPAHRDIFQAMQDLHETHGKFDLLMLTQKLADSNRINAAGGAAYIAELASIAVTSANIEAHADHVKDKSIHRSIVEVGNYITALGYEVDLTSTELLERAEQKLVAVSRISSGDDLESAADVVERRYDELADLHEADDKQSLLGLRLGFDDIDRKVEHLEPGSLMIIAARPSMGKTALALSAATNVLEREKKVALFSLEMSKREVIDRLIVRRMDLARFRRLKAGKLTDDEFAQLGPTIETLNAYPLYIDDQAKTMPEIRSKARRMKMMHGLDLIIVDYLQLIDVTDRAANENRVQEVTYISRSLKNLAGELNVPVIALSQLNRKAEERAKPIPQLADLRESGAIEQDADTCLMLYRESMYNEDCSDPGVTDVYIRKNRNGETGCVQLFFDAKSMSFHSLAPQRQ